MKAPLRYWTAGVLACMTACAAVFAHASAYNGRPKLIVVLIIDQFRGDYLERYRDQFVEGGFRLFLDRGAVFTDCYYQYANTRTAPGHATLLSGAYSDGHGIMANEWWDPQRKRRVSSVEDDATQIVGVAGTARGASPRNLMASTLGDELKLASDGKSHVFGIALKDRAAVLPAGYAADGAYWIDHQSGAWVTSTYYRTELPKWASDFNSSKRTDKYWDRDWRDSGGNILRSTAHRKGKGDSEAGFYEVVGATPFANDYEFEFAKELILYEQLGGGPATDLLTISLSANDILGHEVGPNSPEMQAMVLATDHQLAEFFNFLGHQIGLANVWIAFSADHGIAPLPSVAAKLHLPASYVDPPAMNSQISKSLASHFPAVAGKEVLRSFDYPDAWLNEETFTAAKVKEEDAEHAVGEAMKQAGMRGYFTRSQLAHGEAPNTQLGRKYLHSYSPEGGWYVLGVPNPFSVAGSKGTDHAAPYTYDTHVPLAFYGLPFQLGTFRTHAEPVDLAVTFASLLGINAPSASIGRVLTESLAMPHHPENPAPAERSPRPSRSEGELKPASLLLPDGGRE